MRFFDFFKKKEKRNADGSPVGYVPYSDALCFSFLRNNYSAMNVSAFFAATNLISNTIASLNPKVLIRNVEGKNELSDHPLCYVLNQRNDEMLVSLFSMLKLICQSVILRGNAFVYIYRGADGSVKGLRYLEPSDVIIDYRKEKDDLRYDVPILKLRRKIEPVDMLHFVLHSYNGIEGISLLQFAARSLGIANASDNAAKNFFENGMNVNGILKVTTPISEKQKQDIRSSWAQAYSGKGGIAILNANMEYQQLTLSPEDSQLLSSRQFNVADIARFFNINPLLLGGDSGVNYSSLEMLMNSFLTFTLQPYIRMIETELNRKLLKPSEANLEIILETNDLLRIDKQAQANYYKAMIDSGILSRNEVRKEIGYAAFDGGDDHTVAYSDAAQNTIEDKDTNTINTDD